MKTVKLEAADQIVRGPKTKEQKRKEAEERNNRYKLANQPKQSEGQERSIEQEQAQILEELANPQTHTNPQHVASLSRRLGEIKKILEQKG